MFPSVTFIVIPLLLLVLFLSSHAQSRLTLDTFKHLSGSSPTSDNSHGANGTNWALLVAGSKGFENYRHQADICHAYHILKKGGLKDENIIVFMYDDIANDEENPKRGTIINRPKGPNVYKGVPKDYTGNDTTASNLLAIILGDEKAVNGGSGKVLKSGQNDHIFIYYADHGSAGLLGMPVGDELYAKDLIDTLKKKHAAKSYSRMVIYVEACEAGSMFDGLLSKRMKIYVTTASNPKESSWATYCPGEPGVPKEYDTCLGDLYSVAWMEDSDKQNPKEETLESQYQVVKKRTIGSESYGSHVMQYGDTHISSDITGHYFGDSSGRKNNESSDVDVVDETPLVSVDQREADIVYLRQKVKRAPEGSKKRAEAQQKLDNTLAQRRHVDQSVEKIGQLLFGSKDGQISVLNSVRPAGKPLVDDWDCLKSTVESYKAHCGSLDSYGRKYMRAFANICNAGVRPDAMAKASARACKK